MLEPRAGSQPDNEGVVHSQRVEVRTASEYAQWYKQPYAAEYFQLSISIPTHAQHISQIEEYVTQELQRRDFPDSLDNYRFVLDELAASMGLSPREDSSIRLRKMARWIKNVIAPQQRLEQVKKKILG